jgi:hypothetical protein
MRTRLMLVCALLCLPQPAQATTHHGIAAQHRSLERVARVRGMDAGSILFASPIAPIGARLCVSSAVMPEPVCGTVVDEPQPHHRQWQIDTGRIIEVQPDVARRLCRDASGPPRDCPVRVWREHP